MNKDDTALSILIADHEPDVRQALHLVCEESIGLAIAAEVSDNDELRQQMTFRHPDILLLEWELPGLQPAAFVNEIRSTRAANIIIMGGHPEVRAQALQSGADGFVYKGDPPKELIHLLRAIIEARSRG